MTIPLRDMISIDDPENYKLHLACSNKVHEPLDVFVRDRDEWEGWNSYMGYRDDFNKDNILSLIDFYHEPNIWLFGGIYHVRDRREDEYIIELDQKTESYVGRLKVHLPRPSRTKAFKLENYYDEIHITELLKSPYSGEAFCGYENVNIDFKNLELLIQNNKRDWRAALENVKGIYLITDTANGKKYVGSAYGGNGIWSRWSSYIFSGHGHNDELKTLIKKKGIAYARDNFIFCLLEFRSMKTDDIIIIERENYWKEVLLTRGEFGYNRN